MNRELERSLSAPLAELCLEEGPEASSASKAGLTKAAPPARHLKVADHRERSTLDSAIPLPESPFRRPAPLVGPFYGGLRTPEVRDCRYRCLNACLSYLRVHCEVSVVLGLLLEVLHKLALA